MDIELYIDSSYCGFYPIEIIKSYTIEYHLKARHMCKNLSSDSVVIYAIFSYDPKNQRFCSANFMTLTANYDKYVQLCSKISKNNRIFFVRKNTGDKQ